MIYKTISSKTVVARLLRTLKPQGSEWVHDAIEWIGEAMAHMHHHTGLEKSAPTKLTVAHHRVALPCDFYQLRAISYNGVPLPYSGSKKGLDLICEDCDIAMTTAGDYYQITPDWIITSFEDGDICIWYYKIPTDPDGLPLIPDDIWFSNACFWYTASMMLLAGHTHPVISFKDADAKWSDARIRALNSAAYPSIDRMENFKNSWSRLIPRRDDWSDFFIGQGDAEYIDLD